jgi:hypothetical protein
MSQEKAGEITIAGKRVPVYYEDKSGKMVVPGDFEREIVLDFVGRALATPVTAVTIVVMGAYRDIRVTYEKARGFVETELLAIREAGDVQNDKIRSEAEVARMKNTLDTFGSELAKLSDSNYPEFHYPEEVKKMYADNLKRRMEEKLKSFKG